MCLAKLDKFDHNTLHQHSDMERTVSYAPLDLTDQNLRAIHAAAQDVDAMEADRLARVDLLMDDFRAAIDTGDAYQTVFFAGKQRLMVDGYVVNAYYNLGDVLYSSLDFGEGSHEVIQYVLDMASGGDKRAQELIEARARAWVEAQ
jgi:hypothetical protein